MAAVVIDRLGDVVFSPYGATAHVSYNATLFSTPLTLPIGTSTSVPQKVSAVLDDARWITLISNCAATGIPQGITLAVVAVWLFVRLVQHRQKIFDRRTKISQFSGLHELGAQATRVAALCFLAIACSERRVHVLDLVIIACAFVLGLLRLAGGALWRRIALHQVNFLLTCLFLSLSAAYGLPCIQTGRSCVTRDIGILGSIVALATGLVVAFTTPMEWVPPQIDLDIPGLNLCDGPAPEENCSWFTYFCSYNWLTPIIWKGTYGKLEMADIPKIAWYDEPLYLLHHIQESRKICKKTLRTVIRFQKSGLFLMSFWIAVCFAVENIAAFAMFKLLEYLADPAAATYKSWVWLLLMFVGPLLRSVCFQQYVFHSTRLVVRLKSGLIQELYYTALNSMELEEDPFEIQARRPKKSSKGWGNEPAKSTSSGRLANLMASDIEAIYRSRDIIMVSFGVPVGTAISLIGMYKMMGWASLVGTLVLVLATPLSIWMSRVMLKAQREVRKAQDSRLSLATEYLASLRAIKYFAWEEPITQQIFDARAAEQKQQWRVSVYQGLLNQITQMFPYISLVVMFGLHVGLSGRRLDAATAFTTIYLVKNIRRNIMSASNFARNFASAIVSVTRLDMYFESTAPLMSYPVGPLQLRNASFRRNKKAVFTLNDITLDFAQGGLNVVSGSSGSGKSTLLLGILGETYIESGSVTRPDDVAYASQSAWLQNETIKENIIFGSPLEETRYDRVIEACCLAEDFRELTDADLTVVGENGTSLSGGQRARVALARALYSKAPLLLLDDIFAALDAKTSAGVWKHCFCGDLLRGRTVVLVTNLLWIAEQADLTISLEKGQVSLTETHIGVVRQPIALAQVLSGDADDEEDGTNNQTEHNIQSSGDALNDTDKVANEPVPSDIVNQEMKASGKIGRLTVFEYMGYFGHPLFAVVCVGLVLLSNILQFVSNLWLSVWVEAYNHQAHVDIAYYLGIFSLIVLLEIVVYFGVIIMFEWGAWIAARRLHNDFIKAILRVSLSWFKHVPIGRILNRFSADMASIDGFLSQMLRTVFDTLLLMFFRIAAVSSIMPVFMVPAAVTCVVGVIIGEMYTRTAVVIKRLASSAQSPVFSQFSDTLAGLPVIRARAGMSATFRFELAAKLHTWSTASETMFNVNRWVAVRVDFVTALVSLSAGIIAVSQAGVVAAGLVGFSLTNATALSQTILLMVRAMNELEVEMQSFHRVKEYVKLEAEEINDKSYPEEGTYTDDPSHLIPRNWPRCGEVEFRDVTIRYDPNGSDVLSNVNLKFKAGDRVAVVGRTGSGKSTLVLSLLRFTHIVSGEILFDGVDITKVPRRRLRESLTIIPQEAVLFNGTVGSNLDPSGWLPQEVLDGALDNCKGIASFSPQTSDDEESIVAGEHDDTPGQAEVMQGNVISLDTNVDARGENFSHGQRQVLSLCRALIRDSKLMLLDEATASMDFETDRGIQTVLRQKLEATGGDRTLVTIAHRLRTIIDYDTVVVMGAGKVVECGSPRDLYNAKGQFYDMVYHSGEMEELQEHLES